VKTLLLKLVMPLYALALTTSAGTARADDASAPRAYIVKDQTVTTGPNRLMLHSGIWVFGLSYVPVVVVAAVSERHGDNNLYIPVAGPWMDLAARGDCPPNVSCNNETLNRTLIVIDGIFQGLGALNIAGAFIFPETRTVTVSSSAPAARRPSTVSLRILPAKVGANSYGLWALGTF
jgi:hypothetical protein